MGIPIGELSRQTGVKVPTIRYYEQAGLLPNPARTDGNRRIYESEAVRRLRFIRHARDLGFEVEAIREILSLSAQPQAPCLSVDSIAIRHLAAIDQKIERLTALRAEIARMTEGCSHGQVAGCRVMEVLADHGECLHSDH